MCECISFDEFLKIKTGIERVSVIPYHKQGGRVHWLLGKNQYNQITDIGGGCRRHEVGLECLFREIKEETRDFLIQSITKSIFEDVYDISVWQLHTRCPKKKWYILFIQIDHLDTTKFRRTLEIKDLKWIPDDVVLFLPTKSFSISFNAFLKFFRELC